MICTKCGARLMENDQFCPKCGAKVIKEKRCPDCGEPLREGIRFCPKCGRAVGSRKSAHAVSDEPPDITIEAIERNILSETAAEIQRHPKAVKSAPAKKRQMPVPAPPPRGKKPVRREEVWEDEDDYDEEDEWDDEDDWDDDEGIDVITVMTVAVGCILLIVVAFLGFHFYRQYLPKNYEKAAEQEQEQGEESSGKDGGETEQEGREQAEEASGGISRLTIKSNVNVRDQPSTSGTNVLKVAKEGETYDCNGSTDNGEWYEIVLEDGTVGYVFHEYISIE